MSAVSIALLIERASAIAALSSSAMAVKPSTFSSPSSAMAAAIFLAMSCMALCCIV